MVKNAIGLVYRMTSQIRGISTGVHVLHTMNPPIVHGDLKGVSVDPHTFLRLTCILKG